MRAWPERRPRLTTSPGSAKTWRSRITAKYEASPGRRMHVHAAMDFLFDYETGLAIHLIDGLQRFPRVQVQGVTAADAMERRVPTVSFTVNGQSAGQHRQSAGCEEHFRLEWPCLRRGTGQGSRYLRCWRGSPGRPGTLQFLWLKLTSFWSSWIKSCCVPT